MRYEARVVLANGETSLLLIAGSYPLNSTIVIDVEEPEPALTVEEEMSVAKFLAMAQPADVPVSPEVIAEAAKPPKIVNKPITNAAGEVISMVRPADSEYTEEEWQELYGTPKRTHEEVAIGRPFSPFERGFQNDLREPLQTRGPAKPRSVFDM